jgi:hypothetical protein
VKIVIDHPDQVVGHLMLTEALGTNDPDFVYAFLLQLVNASSSTGSPDQMAFDFLLSVVKGIKPRDQIEAMLAAQMGATHAAIMTFTRRLAHVEKLEQQDSAERALNKLTRTFASQMEALKRYRTSGEQKVTVQHVSVSDNSQAIVGDVNQYARQPKSEKAGNDAPEDSPAQYPALPLIAKPKSTPHRSSRSRTK